jgi:Ecdysteroid kinase-like family
MDAFNFAKSVPSWMDQGFFERLVREMEKDSEARVEKFNVTAGSKPGDNFASSIFRGKVVFQSKFTRGETKCISVIIKTQIMGGSEGMQDFLRESPLFRNDSGYQSVIKTFFAQSELKLIIDNLNSNEKNYFSE